MRQTKLNRKSADKLDEAAVEIETHGLTIGRYGTSDGPKCMLGAINYVVFGDTYAPVGYFLRKFGRWAVYDKIIDTLVNVLPSTIVYRRSQRTVMNYSDTHNKDEVIGKLREAASNLRNKK